MVNNNMDKAPKILIKHSRIEINDYDIGDAPRLESCK